MSVNLHACAREQLCDLAESIATDAVHEHGRLGLLGFALLDHFEQAVPHGLPLNSENRTDSVGEGPSLRV